VCATSPAEALQASSLTLLFLADLAAIESVLFNESTRGALCVRLIVNMGTISPADSLALGQALREAGTNYAECPVLGSLRQALSGTLILMFGGLEAQFSALLPLLRDLGGEPRHIGAVGQVAALKLALNQGCKNFCVNGHLPGNCRPSREHLNDRKRRTDRQPAD